ncbi:hypothetical protein JCM10213_005443 [Rhodosporidiobolus nylandii]
MSPPVLTSAYLAQQAMRAARAQSATDAGPSGTGTVAEGKRWRETPHDSDASDSDEDTQLQDEHFLDPLSDEGIACKVGAYAALLSSFGQQYVLELPRRVLERSTGFTETFRESVLTIQALNGEDVLAVGSHRLDAAEEDADLSVSSAVFHSHTLPLSAPPPPPTRRRRSPSPPPPSSGSFQPIPLASPPPFADLPGVSARVDAASDELVQLYHFTGAGEHRDSTALGRLLEDVADAARVRRAETAARSPARDEIAEALGHIPVFQVVQEEEVEEEVEEIDALPQRQRENVGR